jgi:phenylpyruvate tautomerase PptA (4-oxalocrotonate tautomerase family)
MPLIKVQTSVVAPVAGDVETLLKSLSASLAKHTKKPESYVMTAFEAGVHDECGADGGNEPGFLSADRAGTGGSC